jgi:carbonic anhydrase/acetyltransferase-like protein (isoleucine patch superfamily)
MIRAFEEEEPTVADSAYVDPEATVIGNVTLDAGATVLPGAVIRGDGGGEVHLRENANVQDNVTIHADAPGQEVVLEANAAVGHNAIVHNTTVGQHSLVGMGATVLDGAMLEPYSVVAANSLVTEGTTVESETLVGGTPATVIKEDIDRDRALFATAQHYTQHVEGLQTGLEETE